MIKFENGKHLTNYLLKILKNTNSEMTWKEEKILKDIPYIYDFIEFYIDTVECPVTFDSNFYRWIAYAQNGNFKKLCNIVFTSLQGIDDFKTKKISFDILCEMLDLDIKYRYGYLNSKPSSSDIYYPYNLEVISTKIRNSIGKIYCYLNPKELLTNNYGCYVIYDFDDKNKISYVGKSNSDLLSRASTSARQRVNGKFSKIDLLEMPSHADTNIYEMFLIAKYRPQYNVDSCPEDSPTFELPDIAKHLQINFIKEEPFDVKQICFEKEFVTKEEFWSNGNYLLFTEDNLTKKRNEICGNIHGIIDGENVFHRKDLYEQNGFLCSLEVTSREMQSM